MHSAVLALLLGFVCVAVVTLPDAKGLCWLLEVHSANRIESLVIVNHLRKRCRIVVAPRVKLLPLTRRTHGDNPIVF